MLLSPAGFQFRAVHLLARGTGIPGGNDRMVLIDNNGAKIAPQAGALVGTPQCKVKKIVVPGSSHS
jgi:hypothetical protein